MEIEEYQLKELERARALSSELANLHVPTPVMSWSYEIIDKNGIVTKKGIGKSNSYTRNSLDRLSYNVGLCDAGLLSDSVFGDGSMCTKTTTGSLINGAIRYNSSLAQPIIYLGITSTAESLDSYELPSSGLTLSKTSVSSSFNTTTRKLITVISVAGYNGTASAIDIVEAGIRVPYTSSVFYLAVRDVFAAKTVPVGHILNWTYVTEVSYPNP